MSSSNQTESEENDLNDEDNTEEKNNSEDKTDLESKAPDEKPAEEKTSTSEKPEKEKADERSSSNSPPDSINEKLEENDEVTSTPQVAKITTTKVMTTTTNGDGNSEVKTTTTRQVVMSQQNEADKALTQALAPSSKKSAGAQVAEVIDKLVAQRHGQGQGIPHIVVVAPFKLKNGNKKLTVTEGNVHGIPAFGSRSISAQSLANMLNNGNKEQVTARQLNDKMTNKMTTSTTTVSTTPSTSTTEEAKSPSNDETGDEAKGDEETKTEDGENGKSETNEENESKDEKPSDEGEKTSTEENDESDKEEKSDKSDKESEEKASTPDDEEADEDEEATTTAKPVLINRIKEAVRGQAKKEKQLAGKREGSKKAEKPSANEKLRTNASTNDGKDKQDRVRPTRTRTRKTSSRKKNAASRTANGREDGLKNDTLDENIARRNDEELPEKLMPLDLTKDEDLFLKAGVGFMQKGQLEKAFKELEKSKNLKYQEHEYTHQSKERESYYSSSSNNHRQTAKPILNLQSITQPSASPPPQPQMNQHFLVNPRKPNGNNKNAQAVNFNKQFMANNKNQLPSPKFPSPFTLKDHRPQESRDRPRTIFHKGQAPAPASFQMSQKRHHPDYPMHANYAAQQNHQQKQILNQLLQANAAASNQIQRSMNLNSNTANQLSHLNMPSPNSAQRAVHIPKQQLIQHIQMLSNMNSKHTFPTQQSPLFNAQQAANQPKFIDLSSMNNLNAIGPTPLAPSMGPMASIGPDQYAELSQMMDAKLPQSALAAANVHYQEQLPNGYLDSNGQLLSAQPTKPQIHYADSPFSEASNVNPTNLPPSNNLQASESIGHSQHSPAASNMLSVGDSSNSAVVNFNMKDPPGADKGLHMSFGSGPSSGGAQLITNPLGIFKSLFLPLLPKPRMNLNGKVVFGVVLDTNIRKPPKTPPPVIVVPASKPHHHFFG